jgi:hypothetical protein
MERPVVYLLSANRPPATSPSHLESHVRNTRVEITISILYFVSHQEEHESHLPKKTASRPRQRRRKRIKNKELTGVGVEAMLILFGDPNKELKEGTILLALVCSFIAIRSIFWLLSFALPKARIIPTKCIGEM